MAMANSDKKNFTTGQQYADKLNEMVRKKAFEICQKRGCVPGKELDDWLEAERMVKREIGKL